MKTLIVHTSLGTYHAGRCYVCGGGLKKRVRLVAMTLDIDRVFLVHEECYDLVKDDDRWHTLAVLESKGA
jgi:hypothetical protein